MRGAGSRGGALASTLLVILFLVVFGLTLANLATFDLRTVSRNGQKQLAFGAAQAGLDAVIAELSRNPRDVNDGDIFEETLDDGSRYRVSFDSSESGPWSFNNLDSFGAAAGFNGRQVPGLHASIFAVGTSPSGEESSVVECLIRLEAIPYAVAGTGKVDLLTTTVAGTNILAPTEAHVYSGAAGSGSLRLDGATIVTGDARSVGKVEVGPFANVQGEVESDRTADDLPDLNIETFDTSSVPGVTILGAEGGGPGPIHLVGVMSGTYYVEGDATLGVGALSDAVIFVNGDLEVRALAGRGTIFVAGETTFSAAVNLTGGNRVTLFSQGDITFGEILELGLPLPSIFTGVIFSKGDIKSTGPLTVLGAVYAVNKDDPSAGNIEVGNLLLPFTVVHVSESTSFASYWLAMGGEAKAIRVYWRRLR